MSSPEHYLLLFGGQGSTAIFSHDSRAAIEDDLQVASAGSFFLSKCHKAFLSEISSLDQESQNLLAINLDLFPLPRDLLNPATQYHTHPVFEATTLYLFQTLHHLSQIQHFELLFEDFFDKIRETAGFSSGILPAAVSAQARSLDGFVTAAVEGFRIAFWTACRTHLWALSETENKTFGSNASSEVATSSLVIRGLSPDEVSKRLNCHFDTQYSRSPVQDGDRRVQISAVSSSDTVSVSGPRCELHAFKTLSIPDVSTTYAHVHGWYHGGNRLEAVVKQVLADLRLRDVSFPSTSTPKKPIRSTLDGSLYYQSNSEGSDSLVEWLVRHLLVHCVHWNDTACRIATECQELLRREPTSVVKVISFGPSSTTLFPSFQSSDSRIQLMDLSPFKPRKKFQRSNQDQDSIAIVGMSLNLPKGQGPSQLWDTLSRGLAAVQEIPESRFKVSDYYSGNSKKPRSMPIKYGAFLEDAFSCVVPTFDNTFFNISPREAKSMDPQQQILLHTTQQVLEDAGYVPDATPSFQRASTGCYVGLATGDYTDNLRDDIDVFYSPGTLRAFHSGRISYCYRLSGPSVVTDTACSSSMVSLYQACRALQNGDCTSAVAGGVNLITSPDMYLGLARGHFLSETGGCKPFDETADGYCRAEGCVLFVLKRLSDAIAENDRIHGVIKNIMVNQSGNSHSITQPHVQTQVDLFQRLLQKTNVDPGSVSVVEAHGTGTQAGDTREIESLRTVFSPHHSTLNPLFINSIKGNIGHCEAASGAAGLAKLLLMLRHKRIPVQAGFKSINPAFADLGSSGLIIPTRTTSWSQKAKTPRRALLNNFGAAGSNASLLLEEWSELSSVAGTPAQAPRSAYVFCLSAKSQAALRAAVADYIELLEKEESRLSLQDICYTATARRQTFSYRISMTCSSIHDLRVGLQRYKLEHTVPAKPISKTVFVFSGQGSIYRGMGHELMCTYPAFKEAIMTCEGILLGMGYPSILSFIYKDTQVGHSAQSAEDTISSQCSLVAIEYALARMFISWGVLPDYVIGHSLGEYAALCISGALTLEDTMRIVATRALLMIDNCVPGTSGMLACNMPAERAEKLIAGNRDFSELTVTCFNGPYDCVVGGPLEQLNLYRDGCKKQKVKSKLLDVPYAFHSSAMDPITEGLLKFGRSITVSHPKIPVISNVYGRVLEDKDLLGGDYFALHARRPVQFLQGIQYLQATDSLKDSFFLDIGPHPTALPFLQSSTASIKSCTYSSTLKKIQDAWVSISSTLASISLHNVPINWREVFSETGAKMADVPGHLLSGTSFMIPYKEPLLKSQSFEPDISDPHIKTGFDLLPWLRVKDSSVNNEHVLETTLGILGPLISGHKVGGSAICPASVFHELVLEAAQTCLKHDQEQVFVVTDLAFTSPLVYEPSHDTDAVLVYITNNGASSSRSDFRVISYSTQGEDEKVHCTGGIITQSLSPGSSHWVKDAAFVARQRRYFNEGSREKISTFQSRILYEVVFTRVVTYSEEYQSLAYLSVADSNLEGIGSFKLPSSSQSCNGITQPIFTDTLLHAAGFIANLAVSSDDQVGICAHSDAVEISYHNINYNDTFTVYCSLLEVHSAILADVTALDSGGRVVAVIRGMKFKTLRLPAFQRILSPNTPQYWQGALRELPQGNLPTPPGTLTPPTNGDDTRNSLDSPCIRNVVQQSLKSIVMEVGGFTEKHMDYSKSLDELGIDSLMQIEIVTSLKRTFPGQDGLEHHVLTECETLGSLEDTLLSIMQPAEPTPTSSTQDVVRVPPTPPNISSFDSVLKSPTLLHQSNGTGLPLCLFHDGSGQINMYGRLPKQERSVLAFSDPHFGLAEHPHKSIQQMANSYIFHLTDKPELFPLVLGGWSFGGVVAFEAAQQLLALGFDVRGLVLIDSPSPIHHQPLPQAVIANITHPNSPCSLTHSPTALSREFEHNASLLGSYTAPTSRLHLKTVLLRSQDLFNTESICGVQYDWLSSQTARDATITEWEGLVGGPIKALSIPGHHFEAFSGNNIEATGAQLQEACQFIES